MVSLPDGRMLAVSDALQAGIRLHNAGRPRKAGEIYASILRADPRHVDAMHLAGVAARQLGDFETAVRLMREAVALHPNAALIHNNLGEALCAMGRSKVAVEACRKAISLDPGLPQAHFNLGEALRMQGKADEATSCFERAIALKPDYLESYLKLGDIMCSRRRFEEAKAWLQKGLTFQPQNVSLLSAVGVVLRAEGRIGDAIAHYRHVIAANPHVPELHYNLALACKADGKFTEAAESLRQTLALRPQDADARHQLDILERRNTDKAPEAYVRSLFDNYAEQFDQHLVQTLQYQMPKLMGAVIRRHWAGSAPAPVVLDLGCGTGLLGAELADFGGRLTGIDLSPRMIEKARERNVYERLIAGELVESLTGFADDSVDIAAAADVFVYIGNLAQVFEQCRRVLRPRGLFMFSVESAPDDGPGFVLLPTGRYAQSQRYLRDLSRQYGFGEIQVEPVTVRKQSGRPTPGFFWVLGASTMKAAC